MNLRPYQQDAVQAIGDHLGRHRSTLAVMPTGTGKTIVFAKVAEAHRGLGRILVLAHREELILQANDKIREWTDLTVELEIADQRADLAGGLFAEGPDVVIASKDSIAHRLDRYPSDSFGLVIVDEAHHAPAKRYQTLLEHFSSAKVLGVTATPDRLDGMAMGEVFETAAFVYEIRDAIESGYLCPIRQKVVEVEGLDLSRVKTVAGDFNQGQLAEIMEDERNLHELAAPAVELAGDRSTLVFTVSVEQAHLLEAVLNRYAGAGKAVALDGSADRDTRRRTISSFLSGEIQFLVNCGLFTEGFDAPGTACVVMARPTKSRALYTQMIGRGTRIAPGKDDLLVLDFAGNAGQHSLISALDVLEGRVDDETKELARKLAQDGKLDILAALEAAEEELARRERLEEARRRRQTARAKYGTRTVDPFKTLSANRRPGRWGGIPPTLKQVDALRRFGLDVSETELLNGEVGYTLGGSEFDKGQASALLDKLVVRATGKLCTYKQARFLLTRGLDPDVTFETARSIMDAISSNGWRVPPEIAERFALQEKKSEEPSDFAHTAQKMAARSSG